MYKYVGRHLQLKLVALVILGIAVAFSAIGWLRIREEQSGKLDDLRRSGQERVDLLAAASANLLIGYDYSNMEALAERVLGQRGVLDVVIRNKAGKVMVRREEKGRSGTGSLAFEAPVMFSSANIGTASIRLSTASLDEETAAVYGAVAVNQLAYGVTLGLLIYFVASRIIVRPITRISEQMEQIIENEFSVAPQSLQVSGNDEIAGLGRIFNDLNCQVYAGQQLLRQKVDLARSDLMVTNRALHERTAELEHALELVGRLAITDALTGLHNRRYFADRLSADFSRARRYKEPLALLLLDVDHFKQINDTHGHAAGDAVLQTLAAIFGKRCRDADMVARVGGDEFAFLLYHSDLNAGSIFAQELLVIVNGHGFEWRGVELPVGLSIGLACSLDAAEDTEALYAAADLALYDAKRDGRNRFAIHPINRGAKAV